MRSLVLKRSASARRCMTAADRWVLPRVNVPSGISDSAFEVWAARLHQGRILTMEHDVRSVRGLNIAHLIECDGPGGAETVVVLGREHRAVVSLSPTHASLR